MSSSWSTRDARKPDPKSRLCGPTLIPGIFFSLSHIPGFFLFPFPRHVGVLAFRLPATPRDLSLPAPDWHELTSFFLIRLPLHLLSPLSVRILSLGESFVVFVCLLHIWSRFVLLLTPLVFHILRGNLEKTGRPNKIRPSIREPFLPASAK